MSLEACIDDTRIVSQLINLNQPQLWMPNVMQFFLTSNVDCSDICCFTQNRFLFKYFRQIFASLIQMCHPVTEIHSSIDLWSLSLSRFCTSASLEKEMMLDAVFHVELAPIISQCWWSKGAITRIMLMMTMMMMTIMVRINEHLVTSPSFLSTARALLSIHWRESMCAFSTWCQSYFFLLVLKYISFFHLRQLFQFFSPCINSF